MRFFDLRFFVLLFWVAALPAAAQDDLNASRAAHTALVPAAFDAFEAMVLAPLQVGENASAAEVKGVCQSVKDNLDLLVAHAQTRRSVAEPASLDVIRELNNYLGGRFQALQNRLGEVGDQIQTNVVVMEAHCPDLNKDEAILLEAMNTALGKYAPDEWCRAMMREPEADRSLADSAKLLKHCEGVSPK